MPLHKNENYKNPDNAVRVALLALRKRIEFMNAIGPIEWFDEEGVYKPIANNQWLNRHDVLTLLDEVLDSGEHI